MIPVRFQAALDAAWSAAILGIIAVAMRHEIAGALTRARAAMDARAAEVAAEAETARKRFGYLATIRDKIIAEEGLIDLDCGCHDA